MQPLPQSPIPGSPLLKSPVLWTRVCGIAAAQAAISLAWVVYHLYIPKLLGQAGFAAEFGTQLLVIESLLAIALEPVMGALSEQARLWLGSRFPFVALGMGLAASLLVAIPLLAVWGQGWAGLGLVLPGVIVSWAIAMTIFRSPVLGLLAEYAVGSGLAQAVSVVMLFGAIAGSSGVFVRDWILSLGPIAAFGLASGVLLVAVLVLRGVAPELSELDQRPAATPLGQIPKRNLVWIFVTGAVLSLGVSLMRSPLQSAPVELGLLRLFTMTHVLSVVPAGWVASRTGERPALAVGLGVLAIGLLGLGVSGATTAAIGLAVLLGLGFSFVQAGTIPFALALVPGDRGALGVGVYFGGASLAGAFLGQFGKGWPSGVTVSVGCLLLVVAAGLVWAKRGTVQ